MRREVFALKILERLRSFPGGIGTISATDFGIDCRVFGEQLNWLQGHRLIISLFVDHRAISEAEVSLALTTAGVNYLETQGR